METENQLLSSYSAQEKVAYLSVIASIATADRQATQDETEFLQALCETADLSSQQEAEVIQAAQDSSNANLRRNLDQLRNSQLRFSLIADIIGFAQADGQYTPDEEAKIREVSAYLGIDQEQYGALNQVANEVQRAQAEGQDITQPQFLNASGIGSTLQKVGISSNMLKGMLGMVAPLLIGRMLGGRAGVGRAGGVVGGGILGSLLGSGMLGNVMGGGATASRGMGGLGSIFSILKGGRGGVTSGGRTSGGLGSVLGGLLGGSR
jgi:uncharacterized tellurite resistance protein B-like protein